MPYRDDEEWDETDDYVPEDGEPETIPCPFCKRQVIEDSPRCPYCENYITDEDAPPTRKPWWVILGVLLCLYAVYRWTAG